MSTWPASMTYMSLPVSPSLNTVAPAGNSMKISLGLLIDAPVCGRQGRLEEAIMPSAAHAPQPHGNCETVNETLWRSALLCRHAHAVPPRPAAAVHFRHGRRRAND